ncbi:MAG: hypothetical protein ACE14S_04455 [Candidatus Bathyarchaeia archaeon]
MDLATRGIISAIIENVYQNQNFTETIQWILDSDNEIDSKEDLTLGYFLGSLANIANHTACEAIIDRAREFEYEQSLKKIFGDAEGEKKIFEYRRAKEKYAKDGQWTIELPQEETDQIRNMLVSMISQFQKKISQEIALKKSKKP